MNKIGIYYAFWEKNWSADFAEYIRKVAALGFDILELPAVAMLELSKAQLDGLRQLAVEKQIELTFSMGLPRQYDVSSGDKAVRERGVQYMKDVLGAIHVLGGKIIGGLTYAAWNAPMEDTKEAHWDRAAGSLREIMPVAEDLGITYCLEVVNRFEQFVMNDHREAIQMVKQVGSPNLKVELDTFHMNIEEDSMPDAICATGELIGHFHIGECNRKPPGTGSMDWQGIFGALKRINYTGHIVMEPFVLLGGEVGGDVHIWREIMPGADLDAEAKKALAFCRKLIG